MLIGTFFSGKVVASRRLLLQLVKISPARCVENPTGLQGVPTDATKQSTRIQNVSIKGNPTVAAIPFHLWFVDAGSCELINFHPDTREEKTATDTTIRMPPRP